MRGIAYLDDARARRCPARLGVAPEKFKVDNGVWWSDFNQLLENGRPLVHLHSWHFLHTLEDFFFVNGVVPVFFLGSGDLLCQFWSHNGRAEFIHRGS